MHIVSLLEIDDTFQSLLRREYLGNSYEKWLFALAITAGAFLALGITKRLVHAHLSRLAKRTVTDVDDLLADLVKRTKRFFLLAVAVWIAHHTMDWTSARGAAPAELSKPETIVRDLWWIGLWVQVGFWGQGLVAYGIGRVVRGKSADDPARTMGVTVLGFLGHTLVWSVVLLSCLQALGAPVTSLIASLGVGGIAVALALQNVLGDLFASITILLDKPFIVGDAIQVGDFVGSIERIGVKTTRLRSVNGEEIVMGNNDLVSSRIRNYKRLNERRVVLALGLVYDTSADVVAGIPAMLREIIEATPGTRFDRAHFKAFGDSALQFEAVYYSQMPEYEALMDVQQAVNLAILRRFESEGIEFAFPTQTVRHVDTRSSAAAGNDALLKAVAAREMKGHL